MDEELFRLGEPVAAFKASVDDPVEDERQVASAEARLTALEAEVDDLRRLVVRLEVERAGGRPSTGDIAMTLEVFERWLRRQRRGEERVDEQPEVPPADVDEAEPAGEEPEAEAEEPEAEAEEPEAEPGEPAEAPAEEPAEAPAEEPEADAEEPEADAEEPFGDAPAEEPGDAPAEEPAEAPAEEPAEEPAEAEAGEPGGELPEEPGEEPAEAPAEEPAEEPEAEAGEPEEPQAGEPGGELAGEAEIRVGRSESVTATIALTLPPEGSVRVQWDFRSELARR